MLNHYVIVDIESPAGRPRREMVFEVKPGDTLKLTRLVGEPSFKSGVMITEGPDELRFARHLLE
jgi:hypothetical protein